MTPEDAQAHAHLFAVEFVTLLEQLLKVWPQFAEKRGCPYPTVRFFKHRRSDRAANNTLYKDTNRFFRRYAVFGIGDAGWRKKQWKGYRSVGSEGEVCWMLRERRIPQYWVNEYRTTCVSICLIILDFSIY